MKADVEQARASLAFDVEADIRRLIDQLRTGWVALAERLYEFDSQQMWRDLGHETLESWLADPDLDIGRRNYFYLKGMWADLVIRRGAAPELLARTESSRWQEVLPAIRRGQVTVKQALADCESLTREDLRAQYSTRGAGTTRSGNGAAPDTSTGYEPKGQLISCPVCDSLVAPERLR